MTEKKIEISDSSTPARDNDGAPEPTADNVARLPLTGQVAAAIRDMIVEDRLQPGERIRERQLAEELKVSRTPLREALKILESEKLIDIWPNRGAIVASPAPEDVRDLLELLGGLEALGGRIATKVATDEEIAEIRALHYEMLAAFARKDRLSYFKLNQRIHKGIIAMSRNSALIETHSQINARVYRARYRSNKQNALWHQAVDQHENIIEALEARDSDRVEHLLTSHLDSTWTKVSAEDYPKPEE